MTENIYLTLGDITIEIEKNNFDLGNVIQRDSKTNQYVIAYRWPIDFNKLKDVTEYEDLYIKQLEKNEIEFNCIIDAKSKIAGESIRIISPISNVLIYHTYVDGKRLKLKLDSINMSIQQY